MARKCIWKKHRKTTKHKKRYRNAQRDEEHADPTYTTTGKTMLGT